MVLYNITLKYEAVKEKHGDKICFDPADEDRKLKDVLSEINDTLGKECGLDGNLSAQIVGGKWGHLEIVMCCNQEVITIDECKQWIVSHFQDNCNIRRARIDRVKEISEKDFVMLIQKANRNGLINRGSLHRDLGFNYHENFTFRVKEKFYDTDYLSKEEAIAKAKDIMAGESMIEEIERIYSDSNEKKYYGNPVHYLISADNPNAAQDIIGILIRALKSNERLLGSRLNYIYNIDECCFHEEDMNDIFNLGKGTSIAIEMSGTDEDHGIYASSYHEVIEDFEHLVAKYQLNTLCFFVEVKSKPGFAKPLVAAVQNDVHLIEIKEGRGTKEKAIEYLMRLTEQSKFYSDREEVIGAIPNQKNYSASEVYDIYNKWFSNGLKNKVYKSYKNCEKVKIKNETALNEPYKELKAMVGLTEIKQLVDQIINSAKIQKVRNSMGMDNHTSSRHMIFTGNPGSAKTTVARLLAQILKQEDVLQSGYFVECGRGDLVAQYVGWTAKQVRKKFREAEGGILFIDEAYSLVDDTNSFGDEAINTIVQEMENHRDDVIVIFAGYPKKMEEFLQKNEGLRSRIAFHLNFPDYKADEMLEILKLMAKSKGMKIDSATEEKCLDIFSAACKNEEFGNGRFARNLLEQAILKQSDRIIKQTGNKKITRKELCTLVAEDFEVNAKEQYKKKESRLGFAV